MTQENSAIAGLTAFTKNINSYTKKELAQLSKEKYWGTYGIGGKHELQPKPLCALSKAHIRNIIITQPQVSPLYKKIFLYLLEKKPKKRSKKS